MVALGYFIWDMIPAFSLTGEPEKKEQPEVAGTKPPVNNQGKPVTKIDKAKQKTIINLENKFARHCQDAEALMSKEEYSKAKELVLEIIDSELEEGNQLWERAAKILSQANTRIITTDTPAPGKEVYTIKRGDSLDKIARKFNTTIENIQCSNELDPTNPVIHPGQQLRIYKGNWFIRVSKSRFKLYLYDGTKLFKIYGIGIGRQDRTPAGTFDITDKIIEPAWEYKGNKYSFGDKENVLGTRWMRMEPTGTTNRDLRGFGIHGTWEPDSIGESRSNGCIRMKNEEVEELFDILPKYKNNLNRFIEVVIED